MNWGGINIYARTININYLTVTQMLLSTFLTVLPVGILNIYLLIFWFQPLDGKLCEDKGFL